MLQVHSLAQKRLIDQLKANYSEFIDIGSAWSSDDGSEISMLINTIEVSPGVDREYELDYNDIPVIKQLSAEYTFEDEGGYDGEWLRVNGYRK